MHVAQKLKMESDWIDYKCKSGQTMFIYNKVTGVHKWPPGYYNNDSPEDNIMYGEVIKYTEVHSIAIQTDDYGCNNGCTSMYINKDHASNLSTPQLQPDGDNNDLDINHDLKNTREGEDEHTYIDYTLSNDNQQEQCQYMKEILHETENTILECEDEQEQRQDLNGVSTSLIVVPEDLMFSKKDNEARDDSADDDNAEKRQLHIREGSSSLYSKELFKCFYCKKQFKRKSKLIQHLRMHIREKPFEWSVCKDRFAKKSHLSIYFRRHTVTKPYKCSYCKKKFAVKPRLKNHLKTHTGEEPFACSYCKKKFSQRSGLRTHLRTHTSPLNPLNVFTARKRLRNKLI